MLIIIGASSFIGNSLYNYCKKETLDVLGTYYKNQRNEEFVYFDITKDSIIDLCNRYSIKNVSTIIICSANVSIDDCKKNEEVSEQLNVISVINLLREAKQLNIKSVFLSSEAVFDGKRGMYKEEDIPKPITLYGKQKFRVEEYMFENLNDYLIFRISRATDSKFGEKDIFHEFYTKIINNQEIICLRNQSFCLTHVEDIAKGIVKSIENDLKGLYHLSSQNYISRYQLAKLYAKEIFGEYKDIYEKDIKEISFVDNRHIYGGLNGDKLADIIKIKYQSIDEMIKNYLKSYKYF